MEGVEHDEVEECALTFYIMGFRNANANNNAPADAHPLPPPFKLEEPVGGAAADAAQPPQPRRVGGVMLETEGRVVEVLLVAASPMTEAEWAAAAPFDACMHVQVRELVAEEQGGACAMRLIEKRLAQLTAAAHDTEGEDELQTGRLAAALTREGFFDLYRIASGGGMHPLDTRPWLMSDAALARLGAEEKALERELRAAARQSAEVRRRIDHHYALRLHLLHSQLHPVALAPANNNDDEDEEGGEGGEEGGGGRHHHPHHLVFDVDTLIPYGSSSSSDDSSSWARWMSDETRWDLHTLEDRELELLVATERARQRLADVRAIRLRQAEFHAWFTWQQHMLQLHASPDAAAVADAADATDATDASGDSDDAARGLLSPIRKRMRV